MMQVLRKHYPEYLMEAAGLGILLMVAGGMAFLLRHPALSIHQFITEPILQRLLTGLVMGLTVISIVYSPWGQQSGAHLNPVVTFTFFRLGKIHPIDAGFYILFQFLGGLTGLLLLNQILRGAIAHPKVHFVVTQPGPSGVFAAFLAEFTIATGMMLMVLFVSNTPRLARYTGLFAGMLFATYITIEAPLSGMSMNPARTFASALSAQSWTDIWIYFTAPLAGMLLAAEVYVRLKGRKAVRCAKLHHLNNKRCIFRCGYRDLTVRNGQFVLSDKLPGS
ncbi:hypothetical protein BST81_10745 [Leptolyngbya sp. 'hensonii']|uniref:MIP/aquaporin family protein n=1 Tax=Leptolyngbya sp. 'hensonii' TaxID=1922337 RepID=UPI00094FC398|nr:aquaporin [Leptolyngbya sp. 'hensonii']OLP18430.1 hypothetical protein BST81_10745 [Leptolyngbya sp. 'hensonii']